MPAETPKLSFPRRAIRSVRYRAKRLAFKAVPQPVFMQVIRAGRGPRIAKYFSTTNVPKLQLGAGDNPLPGWLNTDGMDPTSFYASYQNLRNNIFLDVSKQFPLEDASIQYIFHEHLIEHLPYKVGLYMLKECFRVMKPGGRIRIATPDLAIFANLIGEDRNPEQIRFANEYVRMNSEVWSNDLAGVTENKATFAINHNFRAWGHQFIYDYPTLAQAMKSAGFTDMARQTPRASDCPDLAGIEFRKEYVGIYDALIIEGVKPA